MVLSILLACAWAQDRPADPDSLIEAHLITVEAALRAAPTEHLDPAARAERARLLDILHGYHLAGAFPQPPAGTLLRPRPVAVPGGYDQPGTTPWFVDADERACAVGHLLRASGHDALVSVVSQADNGAWLAELEGPELTRAAAEMGFTLGELARIQPGYRPAVAEMPTLASLEGQCSVAVVRTYVSAGEVYKLPAGWEACAVAPITAAAERGVWSGEAIAAVETMLRHYAQARPPQPPSWLSAAEAAAKAHPTRLAKRYVGAVLQAAPEQIDVVVFSEAMLEGRGSRGVLLALRVELLERNVVLSDTPENQQHLRDARCALARQDSAAPVPPECEPTH